MEYIVGYLGLGIAYIAYDWAFDAQARAIFKQHPAMFAIQLVRWPLSLINRIKNKLSPGDSLGIRQNDSSYYRRWLAKNEQSVKRQSTADDSMMFFGLIALVAKFETEGRIVPFKRDAPHQLGDDAALFEIGCYLISSLSRWMFGKYPSQRERFIGFTNQSFVELSSKALDLPLSETGELFNRRMDFYADMYKASKPERDVLERVTDFVTYAVENGKCTDEDDAPLSLSMERLDVLTKVMLWSTHFVKAGIEMLTKYFDDYPAAPAPRAPRPIAKSSSESPSPKPRPSERPAPKPSQRKARAGEKGFAFAPQFKSAYSFMQGLAAVSTNGSFGFIDSSGEWVIAPRFDDVAKGFSEGLAAVQLEEKWGYIDREGRIVVAPIFDEAHPFSEGLAAVGSYEHGLFGYINKSGKFIIAPKFDSVGSFAESLARVRPLKDRTYGYINQQGQLVIPAQFEESGSGRFSRGLAAAKRGKQSGLIDKTGKFVFEQLFDGWIGDYSEGLASVSIENKAAYIDASGKPAIKTDFHSGERFSEGLAAVAQFDHEAKARFDRFADEQYRTKGILYQGPNPRDMMTWGYIDRTGALAIPCKYKDAEPFSEGVAAVKVDDAWGFIRPTGAEK